MKRSIWIAAAAAAVVLIVLATTNQRSEAPPQYRTAKVLKGDIENAVSATGTVRAVTLVPVGSQVSGRIKEILVDYNSPVKKDQPVALIEPDIFEGRVEVARASLEGARAAVATALAELESRKAQVENIRARLEQARASLEKSDAAVEDARKNLEREERLFRERMIPESRLDSTAFAHNSALAQRREALANVASYEAQLEAAKLEVKVGQARHQATRAQVRHAEATLKTAEIDLSHTVIYSPVEGIVISRDVDVGQTVAASLQAPTLFTIAENLTLMQVVASVDEADIGGVQEGQRTTFTVDAYPERPFEGEVVQVRNVPRVSQNVVTYEVVIEVSNNDLKLKPGMTANVSIIKASQQGVLKVPAEALRFKPPASADGRQDEKSAPGVESADGPSPQGIQQTLVAKLQLTPGQQEQLSQILTAARQEFMALPQDSQRDSKKEQIRANSRRKIRNILSEEQKLEFDKLTVAWDSRRKAAREGGLKTSVWVLSGQDKLLKVPVVLGISDDNHYELIEGNLEEGQEVVVGVASKEKRKKTTPPGFGVRRLG